MCYTLTVLMGSLAAGLMMAGPEASVLATKAQASDPMIEAEADVAVRIAILNLQKPPTVLIPQPAKPQSAYAALFARVQAGETVVVDGKVIGKPAGKWRVFLSDGWPCVEAVREVRADIPFFQGTLAPTASGSSRQSTGQALDLERITTNAQPASRFGGTSIRAC